MLLRPFSSSFRPATLRHSSSSKSSRRHSLAPRGGGSHHHHLLSSISICATCKNSLSAATLDLLLLLLALFCSSFLVASSLAHVFRFLAFLLPAASFRHALYPYVAALLLPLFLAASLVVAVLSCSRPFFFSWFRRRCCGRPRCRGLKKALEFDVQLQTEECIRSPDPTQTAAWKEIDDLPWKGGQQGNNPDYECLRVELRRMAPSNGRAVLLFRARCGCPLAKVEAWGPKRSRRNKK